MARDKNFCEVETLNKLTEVFWQKGYNGASMDDLLQQSNLSRSSLYATYGDKRNIFLKTLKEYAQKQQAYLNESSKKWNTTADAVDELFSNILKRESASGCDVAKGCFMVNSIVEWSTGDEEVNKIIQQNRLAVIKILTKLIKTDIENGVINGAKNPATLASFIFNNYTGVLVGVKGGISRKELTDIKTSVLEILKS